MKSISTTKLNLNDYSIFTKTKLGFFIFIKRKTNYSICIFRKEIENFQTFKIYEK